jgi:TonB family protein
MFAVFEDSCPVHLAHHRSPFIRIMMLALLAHLLVFALTPQFEFKPYQMEKEQPIHGVDLLPNPIIPPEPKENPMPVNVAPVVDDNGEDDTVIPPTMYDDAGGIPMGTSSLIKPPEEFYAFDEPPVLIHFESPAYPQFSRESGIEGFVYVKVIVDRKGMVINAIVLGSDVTAEMEQAALKAARSCMFKPGKQRGVPVPVAVMIPFEFRLSDCK